MTTPAPASPVVGALLAELFDDAGLFPPASLPMAEAFDAHRLAQQGGYRWMLSRFVVPVTRLQELATVATHFGERLRLSVVIDAETDAEQVLPLVDEHGWRIDAFEAPLLDADVERRAADVATLVDAVGATRGFVEVPWDRMPTDDLTRSIATLETRGLGFKLRCGGASPDDFPEPSVVAAVIAACVERKVPLKATAGLHHPFRHPDPDVGVLSHGFVNLLVASALALAGTADVPELSAVISEEADGAFAIERDTIRWRDRELDSSQIVAARRDVLVSIGTCSFREPVDDLVALGILGVP